MLIKTELWELQFTWLINEHIDTCFLTLWQVHKYIWGAILQNQKMQTAFANAGRSVEMF